MSRAFSCSVLALLSVAVAKISPRSLTSNGADFASLDYDYVIVGGGTAGLVVAARYIYLTHSPNTVRF
jgi:ribulose 1,5-bisphosphate synthetase/thiazole synthase